MAVLDASMREGIVSHMNDDHADAVLLYAQVFAGVDDATGAVLVDMDDEAMTLEVTREGGMHRVTVPLARPIERPGDARKVLVDMVRDARARLGAQGAG